MEVFQRQIIALGLHAGQAVETIEQQLGAVLVGAEARIFRVKATGGVLHAEEAENAPDQQSGQQDCQHYGAQAAHDGPPCRRTNSAFSCSVDCGNLLESSAETACSPYHARSKRATLPENSARARGRSRARRFSSFSYSRSVLPAWMER